MADNRRLTEEQKRRIAEAHRKAAQGNRAASGAASGKSASSANGTRQSATSNAGNRTASGSRSSVSGNASATSGKKNTTTTASRNASAKSAPAKGNAKSAAKTEANGGKKKMTPKMKQTIRRSVAGVCLASSLIIAAIPGDRSGVAKADDATWEPSTTSGLDYSAASSDTRNGGVNQEAFLDRNTHSADHCSFLVYGSGSNYSLDFQYDYYEGSPSGGSRGAVISNFNQATMNAQTRTGSDPLVIDQYVITAYSEVEDYTAYVDYKNDLMNRWFDVPAIADAATPDLKINSYILDNDDNPINEREYEYSLIKEFLPTPEETVKKAKMDSENIPRYYCETHSHSGETIKEVNNNTKDNTGYRKYSDEGTLYIYCKESGGNTEFLKKNEQLVVGIASEAFGQYDYVSGGNTQTHQALANCSYVEISPQIIYIGDRAFYNCSSLKTIDLGGIKVIGNGVFQHCNNLNTVYMSEDTELIGKEAFEGCSNLKNLGLEGEVFDGSGAVFPSTVKGFAFGSFANCESLQKLDFSNTYNGTTIGEYAFYNLNSVSDIIFPEGSTMSIGTAAFAIDDGTNNKLKKFEFPNLHSNYTSPSAPSGTTNYQFEYENGKTYTSRIGDYILANRTALEDVTFHSLGTASVGYSDADKGSWQWVPYSTVQNCKSLKTVHFSQDEGFVAFDDRLFRHVEEPEFCVWGPGEASSYTTADNKKYARPRICTWTAKANNGLDYVPYRYQVGDDVHYEVGMEDESSDCKYICDIITDRPANGEATLQNCIYYPGDEGKELGLTREEPFVLPSQVGKYQLTQLGGFDLDWRQSFDPELKKNIHHLMMKDGSVKYIGDSAFSGAEKLESVTMPKDIQRIGDLAFGDTPNLRDVYWGMNSSANNISKDAFYTKGDRLYFHGNVTDSYYPFNYAMGENYINTEETRICYVTDADGDGFSQGLKMIRDNASTDIVLIDYPHINDLNSQNSNDKGLAIVYCKVMGLSKPSWISDELWNDGKLSGPEQRLLEDSRYIHLPKQVTSIDTKAYLDNKKNAMNLPYFADSLDAAGNTPKRERLYEDDNLASYPSNQKNHIGGYHAGLFSCETEENVDNFMVIADNHGYESAITDPEYKKGNDWILEVTMPGVTAIPDFAFDSCENLQSVTFGENLQTLGKNVFQGCKQMNAVASNASKFPYENNIIFEIQDDGTKKVMSCLPGTKGVIELGDDVSALNEEAFCGCEEIASIDLNKTTIKVVPERAFDHCRLTSLVKLPETVHTIESEAFDNSSENITIQIPNTGIMEIADDSFDRTVQRVTLRGYRDSTPELKANRSSTDNLYFEEIGKAYIVTFRNDDRTIIEQKKVYLNENETFGNTKFPETEPVPLEPDHVGWKFSRWLWIDHEDVYGNDLISDIREDRDIIALFTPEEKQKFTVTFLNDDGSPVRVDEVYEGSYVNPPVNMTSVNNPTYAFVGWAYQPSTFSENQPVTENITATAKYSKDVYTVKLYYDDMTLFKEITVEKGGYLPQLDIPEDSKINPGKQFVGWKFSPSSFKVTDRVTQDGIIGVAAYSTYDVPDGFHSVTFYNDDDTIFMEYTVPDGGPIYNPGHPSDSGRHPNEGYTFDKWSYHPTKYNVGVAVSENVIAVAVWEYLEYKQTPTPKPSGTTPSPSGPTTKPTSSPSENQAGYLVTVENGAGTGRHKPGEVVTITAYAATEGKVFDRWTTSNADIGFSNAYAVATTFIMPTHDVKVTATYKSANATPTVSGNTAKTTGTPTPVQNPGNNDNVSGNTIKTQPGNDNNGGTEVRITSETIDNNNKNLGTASVSGSTDNFVVKVTDSAAASAAVEQALRNTYGSRFQDLKYVAFDISLYDSTGTRVVTNANNLAVTITLPIPDELVPYAGNNKAAAIANGAVEPLEVKFTTIDGVPCMRFTATHFSPYTIYVDTQNLVRGVSDITPKTGDGIAPKWFLSAGMLSLSCVLFLWKDKKPAAKAKK